MESPSAVPKAALRYLKRDKTQYLTEASLVGLEHLKLILLIPPKDRSPQQLQTLADSTKHIKFFAELSASEGIEAHRQCVQNMSYLSIKAGQFLFNAGEEGGCFYIILSGSVAVLAPYRRKEGKVDFNLLTVLRGGDSFGELALISNKPRAASILAREPTSLAVLERSDYLRLLSKIQDARLTAKVDLLQHHPAFRHWTRQSLQKLSYFFKLHIYKRKQVLLQAGQTVNVVFLIQSGDFQLLKSIPNGSSPRRIDAMKRAEVTLISTGEMIGDQEALANSVYSYTCICASTLGEALGISREDFLQRVVNDDSRGCLEDLNAVKEEYRRRRLEKIALLEGGTRPLKLSLSPAWSGNEEGEGVQRARHGLKEAVRRRWHLPHSHEGSLVLERASSSAIIRKPKALIGHSGGTLVPPLLSPSPSTKLPIQPRKSWVDLVVRKYFHRRTSSGVIFSQLKEPEPSADSCFPRSPEHSAKTTATHSHRNSAVAFLID
jgi:CRP-like cAMP-binding protein